MARLNESSSDALECLKKRFVRQNKELVINNSAQSLKIKTLESELARLVEENGLLLEENTHLKAQLQSKYCSVEAQNEIALIRRRVDVYAQEIVASLEAVSRGKQPGQNLPKKQSQNNYRVSPSNTYSSVRRSARGTEDLLTLPIIWEGSDSQRKVEDENNTASAICGTGEAGSQNELARVSQRHEGLSSCSITRIEPKITRTGDNSQQGENPGNRKRRRTSTFLATDTVKDLAPQPGHYDHESLKLLGNDEAPSSNLKIQENMSKVDSTALKPSSLAETLKSKSLRQYQQERHDMERKPLASKPVNTDPVLSTGKQSSPATISKDLHRTKQHRCSVETSGNSKPRRSKELESKTGVRTASRVRYGRWVAQDPDVKMEGSTCTEMEPLTPAPMDPISPLSERNSELQRDSRDTPPPPNAGDALVPMKMSGGGRERRARTTVNYAEPNLISKMRRPTKGLVDAVIRDERCESLPPPLSAVVDNECAYECEGVASTSPSAMQSRGQIELEALDEEKQSRLLSQLEMVNLDRFSTYRTTRGLGGGSGKERNLEQYLHAMGGDIGGVKRERSPPLDVFDCIESPTHSSTRGSYTLNEPDNQEALAHRSKSDRTVTKMPTGESGATFKFESRRRTVGGRKRELAEAYEHLGEAECSNADPLNTQLAEVGRAKTNRTSLRRRRTMV